MCSTLKLRSPDRHNKFVSFLWYAEASKKEWAEILRMKTSSIWTWTREFFMRQDEKLKSWSKMDKESWAIWRILSCFTCVRLHHRPTVGESDVFEFFIPNKRLSQEEVIKNLSHLFYLSFLFKKFHFSSHSSNSWKSNKYTRSFKCHSRLNITQMWVRQILLFFQSAESFHSFTWNPRRKFFRQILTFDLKWSLRIFFSSSFHRIVDFDWRWSRRLDSLFRKFHFEGNLRIFNLLWYHR